MKKKLLSALLTVSMLLILLFSLGTPASAATGGTTGSCTWTVSGTTLIISGNGPMADYSDSNLPPWFDVASSITTIEVREGVTSIGDYAFAGCVSATAVLLPNYSLARMGDAAFLMCAGITSFWIPPTVTDLGTGVFAACYQLGSLSVSTANPVYTSQSNCIIERASGSLVLGCPGSVIPQNAGVKVIGEGAFMMYYGQGLVIPEGVTKIAEGAFAYAEFNAGYSYLTFPSTLNELSEASFYSASLPYIELPGGITAIPDTCFFGANLSRGLKIPSTLQSIGAGAFMYTSLSRIDLPEGLKVIGDDAFFSAGLIQKVVIPKTVESIGISAFSANEELYGIEVSPENPYYKAINGCLIEKESGILISACTSSSIPAGEGIRIIGPYAFAYLEILHATIPEGVTEIDEYAFYSCEYLVGARLPSTLLTVGERAFAERPNGLSSLSLKKPFPAFDSTAFENTAVKNVWIEGTKAEFDATDKSVFPNSTWHLADNDCDSHCDLCGSNRYSISHVFSGICDTACDVCSATRSTSQDHAYDNACDEDCNTCGTLREAHVYTSTCDPDCNVCGAVREPKHYTTVTTPSHTLQNCPSYPFTLNDGWYESTNHDHNSISTFTVIANHDCEFKVLCITSCEVEHDFLHIKKNGQNVWGATGSSYAGTSRVPISLKKGDTLTVSYEKDSSGSKEDDRIRFSLVCECAAEQQIPSASLDPTCTEAVVCSDCGETVKEATGHAYSTDCDTDCNTCGETRVAAEHIYSDPCDASCNTCGEGRTPPHSYTDACDGVCDLCEKGRTPPHVYDGASDLVCNSCGHERPPYVPGDLDGKEGVDMDDAIYLLFAINFPDSYETNQPLDFDGSGVVDMDDAIYLLFHVNFSEQYPLFPAQNS